MIQVFLGDDRFSRLRALDRAVAAALGERKDDPLSRQVLHAGDSSIDDVVGRVIENCSAVSMFGPELAVVLRRLESLKVSDLEALGTWIKTAPECLLFLEGEKIDGRSELAKILKKHAQVQEFKSPADYKMGEWIAAHCREEFQISIQGDAATYLAECIGADPAVAHAEIKKIMDSTPGIKSINLEIAMRFVVPQRELDPWEIQGPFGNRDAAKFIQVLRKQMNQGIDPVPITSALYQHAVRLLHTQSMLAEKAPQDEIAKACGLPPWVFSKIQNLPAQATKWPPALLPRIIQRLGEIDYDFKMGRLTDGAQYELAVCALIVR